MSRDEFEEISTWGELACVCNDYGCDLLDDIYDSSAMDETLCESIRDELDHSVWNHVRDLLNDIPCDEDNDDAYYRRNGVWDWDLLDDEDFEYVKADLRTWMEENGNFGDDETPAPYYVDDEPDIIPEPISIEDMFMSSKSQCIAFTPQPQNEEPIKSILF